MIDPAIEQPFTKGMAGMKGRAEGTTEKEVYTAKSEGRPERWKVGSVPRGREEMSTGSDARMKWSREGKRGKLGGRMERSMEAEERKEGRTRREGSIKGSGEWRRRTQRDRSASLPSAELSPSVREADKKYFFNDRAIKTLPPPPSSSMAGGTFFHLLF